VNNPTDEVMTSSAVNITATVNGVAVQPYSPDGQIIQNIEPKMQLNIPFRFTVKNGTTGPLKVTVQYADRRPVYFTGTV
jgi:hypothetical protein